MHIAICNSLYPTPSSPQIFGGAEVAVRQLAEALVERGDRIDVLRMSPDGAYRREDANGVAVHFMPVRNLYAPFGAPRPAALSLAWHMIDDYGLIDAEWHHVLSSLKPDVVHTHTLNGISSGVWRLASRLGIPLVHTLHDYYLLCPKCTLFKDGRTCEPVCGSCSLLTRRRRTEAAIVDAVAGVSRRILDIHINHGVFGDTPLRQVIENAGRPDIGIMPLPAPGSALVVGYLGRIAAEKGIDVLVKAFAMLPSGTARLRIAGNAPEAERNRLRNLAPGADVEFVGFVDPVEFYAGVEVVAFPSLWEEPSGLALLDALAAGRPVIGSDRGAIPEAIEHGRTGWVVQPEPSKFADAVARLAADRQLLQNAHEALALRQSRRQAAGSADRYQALYRSVTGGDR